LEGIALWCLETLITEGINATILQGEVTVLEGKNGCGKSTFLKAFSKLASGQEEGDNRTLIGEQVNVQKGIVISY
jgi:ABC-type cobalamin/Fe3+-siderophores transport system ATPase subunit